VRAIGEGRRQKPVLGSFSVPQGGLADKAALTPLDIETARPTRPASRMAPAAPFGTDVESLRAGWDRSQAEDRQPDRSYVSCVARKRPQITIPSSPADPGIGHFWLILVR
jgi:hypothetical protein